MKKMILSAAALVFAAVSYGQTPTAPTAPAAATTLNPSGTGTDNKGDALQTGNDQKLKVLQVGTNQSALTVQGNGSGTGYNKAVIQQIGNVSLTSGVENMAEVNQMGSSNESTTLQGGDFNEALTKQGQNNDASSWNKARIQQGGGSSEYNKAEVVQDGNYNTSNTFQGQDNNEALTTQAGDWNQAQIIQWGQPDMTDGHAAEVWQRGIANKAKVYQNEGQLGGGARNQATSIQLGDGNESEQRQNNTAAQGGTMNNAFVSQGDAAESLSRTSQQSTLLGVAALDPTIIAGGFTGPSYNADAFQEQDGTDNDAEIHQFGTGSNYAKQYQEGDRNSAGAVQNATGGSGVNNTVYQEQVGNDNVAAVIQRGNYNEAVQMQDGDWNLVYSTQNGNGNRLNTRQFGGDDASNLAIIHTAQIGNNNTGILEQYGNNSYNLVQNGTGNAALTQQYDASITPGTLGSYQSHTLQGAASFGSVPAISVTWP